MSEIVLIRPENLNAPANELMCQSLRNNIYAVLSGPLFHRYERVKAKLNCVQVHDAGQLQRYYAAVQRERTKREANAGLAARYEALPAEQDEEAFRQQEYDECDRDAA
ncbi:hypothetical protein D0N36_06785 [Hymenobacter lapidiphilus]|uniref:hypothetical protein n=1 Tax=Hymenobacter sp. CCM 8763 TaxID=2303334 RepID=UPI000E348BAE|nr:hypothetical protein [Hymenobacter sp. CCM 8763]RFP65903.1 hypothetical protein D0N36_06785 [Hymenobacter sp. CCM 8763]